MTVVRTGLKVKVIGQGQGLRSVGPTSIEGSFFLVGHKIGPSLSRPVISSLPPRSARARRCYLASSLLPTRSFLEARSLSPPRRPPRRQLKRKPTFKPFLLQSFRLLLLLLLLLMSLVAMTCSWTPVPESCHCKHFSLAVL